MKRQSITGLLVIVSLATEFTEMMRFKAFPQMSQCALPASSRRHACGSMQEIY